MKYRSRIYYSAEQKNLMWDRWQAGDSLETAKRSPSSKLINAASAAVMSESCQYRRPSSYSENTCLPGKRGKFCSDSAVAGLPGFSKPADGCIRLRK